MLDHKSTPRRKRQIKTGKNPQVKRQRQQPPEEPLDQLKITDVNNDCLENIFDRLSIDDLLNVADANKWLRVAAASVYRRKYGRKEVTQGELNLNHPGSIRAFNKVNISGLKTCLRFVRCFGHNISHLRIDYLRSSRKEYTYLDRYVNEYCAEALIQIIYIQKSTILMDIPGKLFTNVQNLFITKSNVANRLAEILGWFPNLIHLVLNSNRIDGDSIGECFPRLTGLVICANFGRKTFINHENIVHAVRLNPQLRVIAIRDTSNDDRYPFMNLLEIASKNPSIISLALVKRHVRWTVDTEQFLQLAMALPHLRDLAINSQMLRTSDVIQFIRLAKHLEYLRIVKAEPSNQQLNELMTHIGDEWHSTPEYNWIILERNI